MTETQTRSGPYRPPVRVLEGSNPFSVDEASDWIQQPHHDLPLWNETVFFTVWNPAEGVGVFVHAGVVPKDKTMWWAQTIVFLPDSVVLVDRSFGRCDDRSGPSTGNLRIRCVEPQRRWHLAFDGAGAISSTDELARGLVGAGIATPFSFEIDVEAVVPVYDFYAGMGYQPSGPAGGMHHEQGMRATGRLDAMGSQWSLDGPAIRDHSTGERSYGRMGGFVFCYAVWPESRRAIGAYTGWSRRNKTVRTCMGMVQEDGRTEVLGDLHVSGSDALGGHPRNVELNFLRADGSRLHLVGDVVHNATISYAEPYENLNGAAIDPAFQPPDPLVADESVVRLMWPDGDVGYGHLERNIRASMRPCPEIPLPPDSVFAAPQ